MLNQLSHRCAVHNVFALCKNITAAQVVKRVHSSTHEQDEQILCSVGVSKVGLCINLWLLHRLYRLSYLVRKKFPQFVFNYSIMNEWSNTSYTEQTQIFWRKFMFKLNGRIASQRLHVGKA